MSENVLPLPAEQSFHSGSQASQFGGTTSSSSCESAQSGGESLPTRGLTNLILSVEFTTHDKLQQERVMNINLSGGHQLEGEGVKITLSVPTSSKIIKYTFELVASRMDVNIGFLDADMICPAAIRSDSEASEPYITMAFLAQ
ncbi:hypothetical protein FCM35_KLT00636 [Carex littledalei]|uniref:Uncharacterized protein n=1 Tax=Carex littledalei TaxID=544730 RepID=A0A833VZM6_9POAL|nr:hypothetical protein FCM35_KLT00636 [Carex littledalei]